MKQIQVPFFVETGAPAPPADRHSPAIRRQVWFDTIAKYERTPVPVTPSEKLSYVPTDADIANLRAPSAPPTPITVERQDTLYAAEELISDGYRPAVLNMADWLTAGGCVHTGARTQEEELFRRSNYHLHLLQRFYPLDTYDLILSHDVDVSRDGPDTDYAHRTEPFRCTMIASPALTAVPLHEGRLCAEDAAIMYNKVRQLVYYAAKAGCDSLVLSAWGCGAFHLLPGHVAEIFRDALRNCDGCLRKIVFAIMPYRDNYEVFCEVFCEVLV